MSQQLRGPIVVLNNKVNRNTFALLLANRDGYELVGEVQQLLGHLKNHLVVGKDAERDGGQK